MSYADIQAHKARLDAIFARAKGLQPGDPVQGDLVRHLCVQVSGYLEESITELVLIHAQTRGTAPTVERYVQSQLRFFQNPDERRIKSLLNSLDPDFETAYKDRVTAEQSEAVNSVVGMRRSLAHGGTSTTSLNQLETYYGEIEKVVQLITDILR